MSVAVTQNIQISVSTRYIESESDATENRHCFAYHVQIENQGEQAVRLLSRHWFIKDAWNHVEEVQGEGVIGQTPWIAPGETFEYNSWCPLRTEFGSMRGTYTMQRDDGERFEAVIAPFGLAAPHMLN